MKTIFSILLLMFGILGFSQSPELDDHTWFVHSLETNIGIITKKPLNPEMTMKLEFDLASNLLTNDLCCGGSFMFNLNLDTTNSTFKGSGLSISSGTCDNPANNTFADLIVSFFEDNLNEDFSYSLIQENDPAVKLEIINDSGETLRLYNTPHIDKYTQLYKQTWGLEWHLYAMEINGNSYNFNISNTEFEDIKATFNYDGSFQTKVCSQLTGNFTLGEANTFQDFLLNCGNINTGSTNCSSAQNINIQDVYFSFFSTNSDILELSFIPIDDQTGSCEAEAFQLISPSGDYLKFSSCSLLNLRERNEKSVSIYPNPTQNYIYFNTPNNKPVDRIYVMDIAGKLIKQYFLVNDKIDISTLVNGIYFLKIESGNKKFTQKIIKN